MKDKQLCDSPYNVVEDAIDLAKLDTESDWDDLIRRSPTNVLELPHDGDGHSTGKGDKSNPSE